MGMDYMSSLKEIEKIAAEADKLGLSYGKYVALLNQRKFKRKNQKTLGNRADQEA